MKFDQNGNRIGTKSKETMISSTAYTTTIAHAEPALSKWMLASPMAIGV